MASKGNVHHALKNLRLEEDSTCQREVTVMESEAGALKEKVDFHAHDNQEGHVSLYNTVVFIIKNERCN